MIVAQHTSGDGSVADLSGNSEAHPREETQKPEATATSNTQTEIVVEVPKPGLMMRIMLLVAVVKQYSWYNMMEQVFEEVFLSGNMQKTQDFILRWSYFNKNRPDVVLPPAVNWIAPLVPLFMSLVLCADVVFRGIAQVYLCNHPITGILVCIGLAHQSTQLLVFGIMGTACATLMCWLICVPNPSEVLTGLCGYDGSLIGCAVYSFIKINDTIGMGADDVGDALTSKAMAITCVLSALTGCVHMSCKHLTRLPELTLAFNICIALFLFMLTDRRVTLTGLRWGTVDDDTPPDVSDYWTEDNIRFFYDAAIRGVGQFIFIGTTTGGWMVVTGIAISSRPGAMTAVLGAFTACVSARYIYDVPKASLVAVHNGIYGYSAAGTCASLGGGVFYKHTFPAVVVGVLGAMFTCFVQLSVEAMLKVDNLPFPSLTIPFVSTTWFMMLMRSGWLEPILSKEDEANLNVPLGDSWKSREGNYLIPKKVVLPTTSVEENAKTS